MDTLKPRFWSRRCARVRFTALSSTSKTVRPLPLNVSPYSSSAACRLRCISAQTSLLLRNFRPFPCECQVQRKVKNAALLRNAFQPDPAAHHLDQSDTDSQSEAGAPVLARHGAVGLREWGEYFFLSLRRNPDARVLYTEMKQRAALDGKCRAHGHIDLPALGELNGISDQVQEHLAEAAGIADDVHRERRRAR